MRMFLAVLLVLFCTVSSAAGRYKQPAYITNTYFTDAPQRVDGFPQPGQLFNVMVANRPDASGTLVMNMVMDKGTHRILVDILDSRGRKVDKLYFDAVTASTDNWTYTVTGRFGGELTPGGIFFKVWDRYNGKKPAHLGTFRLLTEE